jgi:DNA-binding CsgD family transcriptional regulator
VAVSGVRHASGAAAGSPDPGQGVRPGRQLYGRQTEMAVLAATLDARADGLAQALFFEGAPGTGKSALLAWARADARRRGWTVLTARASVLETDNDLGVLRQVLATLPALPDGWPPASPGPVPEGPALFEMFERVSAHLLDVASHDPVLVAVDDLQWCDASSLRWLAYLASRGTGLPIAIAAAGFPAELSEHRFLADEVVASCERHQLARLTRAQLRRWLADVLGAPPDDELADGCLEATGGNPALLAGLLPVLPALPALSAKESLENAGTAAVSRRVMPWIRRGGPEALAVAQAVTVLGDDSYPVLVARLAGLSLDGASGAIDQLIKLDILTDASPLRYVHSLTRAVVNSQLNTGLRTSLRLRASRIVRDHHCEPERAAAYLLAVDVADDPGALDTLRAAASSALGNGRPEPALRYLRRALAEPMPGSARAELLAEIGALETGLGVASPGSTLRHALSMTAEPALRVRIATDLAYADASAGNPLGPVVEIVDEACALSSGGLAAEAEFGIFLAYAQSADASEFLSRRLPRFRELAGDDTRLAALAGLADAWSGTRRGRDRAGCVRRTLSALEAIDRQHAWELRLRWPAAGTLIDAEEYDLAETSGRFAHRQGPAGDAALWAYLRGRLAHGRGDLEAARAELRDALNNPPAAGTNAVVALAHVLTDLGELEDADRLISGHVPAVRGSRTWATATLTFVKASLFMARNQHREALKGFLEAGRTLGELGIDNPAMLHWRSRAARCHAILGDRAEATSLTAQEAGLARSWGSPRALSTALAAAGVVALDRDAALAAVTALDGTEAESHRAAALVDLGVVLWETGATDEAHGHLQAGYALARMIGARPTWQRAARYLKHGGGRPDLGRISGVSALTAQERAVAERAATGATNRQIADEMVLTQRTVEQYLTSAYRKLGITGRSGLATALPR